MEVSAVAGVRIRAVQLEDMSAIHEMRTRPGVVYGTTLLPTASLAEVQAHFAPNPHLVQLLAEVDGSVAGHVFLVVGQGRSESGGIPS